MADEKISALPSAGALAGTEPLPIVQGGVTKKTTVQDIANLVTAGNANITPITAAALLALPSFSTTTIYVVTDANSNTFKMAIQAETTSQLGQTGTIIDDVYSGTVQYDLSGNTFVSGTIYDLYNNIWNGSLPSDVTLGIGSERNVFNQNVNTITLGDNTVRNIFHQGSNGITLGDNCDLNTFEQKSVNIILGDGCRSNTFKQNTDTFTFGDNLLNTTIEAGTMGDDYTNLTNYGFLYGNFYPSTIFFDGADNYHRYYDPANDRIVVTLMVAPFTVSYIGGGGGGDVFLANDQTFTGENTFAIGSGNDTPVTITKVGSNAALKVTKSSGSGDAIEVADGSVSIADETASTIAHFDGSKRIKSLATSTYPSLTELARVKGVGSQVVGVSDTNTLTNKRINPRTGTVASSATPTINTDNVDYYSITALATAITSMTTNLSGTPVDGQTLWISITDNGTARAITWDASFEASTIALPTTTVISTRLDVAFIWNTVTSKWRCVGVA
jgi:hypothetical protein